MILVSTIWFSGMLDIMVWPEIILVIALVGKNYHHFRQKGQKSIILMSTIIGFSGMPDIVSGWKVH